VIESQQVQDRGVQIVDMHLVFNGVVAGLEKGGRGVFSKDCPPFFLPSVVNSLPIHRRRKRRQ
jgi:hypothetical protein